MPFRGGDVNWRIVFLLAFPIGAILGSWIGPQVLSEIRDAPPELSLGPFMTIIAGVLVGAGTRLGGGCTSGHGICGLARFSTRSVVAVLVFMATAIVTVFIVRHVI